LLSAIPNLIYTLPRASCSGLGRSTIGARLSIFGSTLWGILVLLAVLNFRWAEPGHLGSVGYTQAWLQGLCFAPLLLLLLSLLHLPLAVPGTHHISLSYGPIHSGGQVVLLDWSKTLMLDLVMGTLSLRARRPHQALTPMVALVCGWCRCRCRFSYLRAPLAVDPLFNHFEPLAQTHPALVQQLSEWWRAREFPFPCTHVPDESQRKVTSFERLRHGFGASQRVWCGTPLSKTPLG